MNARLKLWSAHLALGGAVLVGIVMAASSPSVAHSAGPRRSAVVHVDAAGSHPARPGGVIGWD